MRQLHMCQIYLLHKNDKKKEFILDKNERMKIYSNKNEFNKMGKKLE